MRLLLKTGKLEGALKQVWKGAAGPCAEGPHLDKIRGEYFLMISEGGTSYDHRITIARSDTPWGAFEVNPRNPILTLRHLPDHPFQALGHGDLVELTSQKNADFNFTGVVIALFATGNGQASFVPADFDWFEYVPADK